MFEACKNLPYGDLASISKSEQTRRRCTHIDSLGVNRLVPCWVHEANASRDVCTNAVLRCQVGRVLADAIVDAVDRLDELAIQFQPERLDLGIGLGQLQPVRNDLLAEVPGTVDMDAAKMHEPDERTYL